MARTQAAHIIVVGAGAAGLMTARELARGGKTVTMLEARDRCGGRIHPLSAAEFGYRAEGGAEFVHGEAPLTHELLREAGLSPLPVQGARWKLEHGVLSRDHTRDANSDRFRQALAELKSDMAVGEFLQQHFAGAEYSRLRRSVVKMVEGYDAADPARMSTLALRDEWTSSATGKQARIAGGYGALIDFLAAECRRRGVAIRLGATVSVIETTGDGVLVGCANGERLTGDAVILTVPLPILQEIMLPPAVRDNATAAAAIGFGNVIKLLLRFKSRWWIGRNASELSDLLFLRTDKTIPVWWTQHPSDEPVLTGWIAGPNTRAMADLGENELIETALASLADIFESAPVRPAQHLIAARAINWGNDQFARGAYSYATLEAHAAHAVLASQQGPILLAGEAIHRGQDMGTVEAALASGLEAAGTILAPERNAMA